ncbi:MAG TPA: amino acid permease [Candidatus Krumholzibacteria bacterium]
MPHPATIPRSRPLGLFACVALVIGNIIGSGIFLLPSSLAPYGKFALAAWVFTSLGAISIALVFARLARMLPKEGGPYAYVRTAYGDFPGFWIAWGYWIGLWSGVAAIAVAFGSYLRVIIPALEGNTIGCGLAAIGAVWVLGIVNARGIRAASRVQTFTVIIKLMPLVAIATIGLAWLHPEHIDSARPATTHGFGAVSAAAALTLWALLGLESATIPADAVRDPDRTIPRATVIGTVVSALVYIASTVAVMGAVPGDVLVTSQAPFADAARHMWGDWAYYAVGIGAIVSCFGALNGWILLAADFPRAAARDGLFPARFADTNARGVAVFSLVVAVVLVTVLLAFNYSGTRNLTSIFNFAILLSTLATLIPYVFCAIAPVLVRRRVGIETPTSRASSIISAIAFLYAGWMIYGAGAQIALLGLLLMVSGIPVYVWLRRN